MLCSLLIVKENVSGSESRFCCRWNRTLADRRKNPQEDASAKLILQKYQRITRQAFAKPAMPARDIHSRDLMHPDLRVDHDSGNAHCFRFLPMDARLWPLLRRLFPHILQNLANNTRYPSPADAMVEKLLLKFKRYGRTGMMRVRILLIKEELA